MPLHRLWALCLIYLWGSIALPVNAKEDEHVPDILNAEVLTSYVTQKMQERPDVANLVLELVPISPMPSMDDPEVRIEKAPLRSRMSVELRDKRCGAQCRSKKIVWFEVRAYRNVLVYGQDGRADERATDLLPRLQKVDLVGGQIREDELAPEAEGYWLSRPVRAGMVILKSHLRAEPIVVRSAPVTIIVDAPGLIIQKQGKALRSGAIGERIPVLIAGTSFSTKAVVVGRGEVHVER